MKKLKLIAACMVMMLVLSGCIVINMPGTAGVTGSTSGVITGPGTAGGELGYSDEAVDLDEPLEDIETDTYEVPRTMVPATDADQVDGVKVDFVIKDDQFGNQVDEVAEYSDDYIGKNLSMIGEVLYYDEPNADTQFAIVRWFETVHDEAEEADLIDPETGEVLVHDHDPVPTGFDCAYAGERPQEKAWVRVVGTLEEYQFTDEDGEVFPALKLNVQHMEAVPDGQGGSRTIEWLQ